MPTSKHTGDLLELFLEDLSLISSVFPKQSWLVIKSVWEDRDSFTCIAMHFTSLPKIYEDHVRFWLLPSLIASICHHTLVGSHKFFPRATSPIHKQNVLIINLLNPQILGEAVTAHVCFTYELLVQFISYLSSAGLPCSGGDSHRYYMLNN